MRLRPLFKWFGSKWGAAQRYPPPLSHGPIMEPFAGGAGYALNYADRDVVIWDTDPHLQRLWPWLIQASSSDILDIPIDVAAGTNIRALGLSDGQATLLKSWQRTNSCGDCWTISPWGHLPGQWTANTRARVAEESQSIKHWQFAEPDCDVVGTWFIDPPYQFNYQYKAGAIDYTALAGVVAEIPSESLVIVCEAADKAGRIPSYLPFQPSHRQVTSRRKSTQSHHSSECVYVRSPRQTA